VVFICARNARRAKFDLACRAVLLTLLLGITVPVPVGSVAAAAATSGLAVADHAVGLGADRLASQAFPRPHRGLLESVSCPSRTFCVAVGSNTIWMMEGSHWTRRNSPVKLGSFGSLYAVSCVKADDCIVVGSMTKAGASSQNALALLWNGHRWARMPGVTSEATSKLFSISCVSRTWCVAGGERNRAYPRNRAKTYATVWNGVRWRAMRTPTGAGNTVAQIHSVSCAKVGRCVAVGPTDNYNSSTSYVLQHRRWSIHPIARTARRLYSISCVRSAVCSAAGDRGSDLGEAHPLVEGWNGRRWRPLHTPTDKLGHGSRASAISCVSVSFCSVVGVSVSASRTKRIDEQRWNGHKWKLIFMPPSTRKHVELDGIDCPTRTSCVAVGSATNATGTDWDAIYSYSGGARWSPVVS
jgi:hypothetical protein